MMRSIQFAVTLLTALAVGACAVRRPYTAPEVAPATLQSATPDVADPSRLDPRWWAQFQDPVLDALVVGALEANTDVRQAVARLEQARAFSDEVDRDRFPTVPVGASVDHRDQQIPGFSIRASQHHRLSCRLRRILGAGPVRSRPLADAGCGRERRQPRGLARRCQGDCRRRGRAQLLRAPRAAAAARRAGAEPHEPAGEPAAHDRTARCGHWRGAGCCQCRRPRGRHRGRHPAGAISAGATRASTGGAHWQAPRSARSRPVATRLSSADACARRRTARGDPAAPPGRPDGGASTRRGDRSRGHRGGGAVSARDHHRLSRVPRRPRQPLRHRRIPPRGP